MYDGRSPCTTIIYTGGICRGKAQSTNFFSFQKSFKRFNFCTEIGWERNLRNMCQYKNIYLHILVYAVGQFNSLIFSFKIITRKK